MEPGVVGVVVGVGARAVEGLQRQRQLQRQLQRFDSRKCSPGVVGVVVRFDSRKCSPGVVGIGAGAVDGITKRFLFDYR